jgi:transcription-repair coupling factor (superfamily II helicase)
VFKDQNQEKTTWQELLDLIANPSGCIDLCGLNSAAGAYALAQIHRRRGFPVVLVAENSPAAERLYEELNFFLDGLDAEVLLFPAYTMSPYKYLAYHNETAARRIRLLYRMLDSGPPAVMVTTIGALMQKLIPKEDLVQFSELVMIGEDLDRDALIRKLVAGGYGRTAIVEEPGDFSVRGAILDVFSPLYEDPVRIEFFGDSVESIRLFAADSQRTVRNLDEAVILPARETVLSASQLNMILGRIRTKGVEQGVAVTRIREMAQGIKADSTFPGLDKLLPLIYAQPGTLFDYLSPQGLFVLWEPGQLIAAANEILSQARTGFEEARQHGALCAEPAEIYLDWSGIEKRAAHLKAVHFKSFTMTVGPEGHTSCATYEAGMHDTLELRHQLQAAVTTSTPLQPLLDWLVVQKEASRTTLIVCRRPAHVDRLQKLLEPYGLRPVVIKNQADIVNVAGRVYLLDGIVSDGFVWPDLELALITDQEIFGTTYKSRKANLQRRAAELLNFEDLKQGDLVVHNEHGIGQYEGLVKLRLDNAVSDFLLVVYKDGDKLYLPVERMNQVQKYMGVEGAAPMLDKMGGKTWERVKLRVKRSTEKIAGELLKLYAARKVQKGHAFGAMDAYFREFEDGFPFEETADQQKAIQEVLDDMQGPQPMDRLVCGDVGYGKTEIALRASFLAISEAKQVAVLVPTTVLAEQHFATFRERFKRFPVKVRCLSRFRPAKEQRDIVAGIKDGTVDIVIGTHRLLQKDISFRDLGLLILDEEQRFGVRDKEKIKRMRANVDALALTATPIPRTLHLSLLGIRDISLISTPPEQRRPIITFISAFEDTIIADAVRKELQRRGQVFFVHNHVMGIERMAEHLHRLVPEARLAVAHGQMAEDVLEKVMLDFGQKKIDLLVCTTIIESGLDVATANTIIINRADKFGLAQIYQLRGRVGRSDEQAYAYLFIPDESILTKDAQKRLKVLMEYSDLGSGFQIAMSDLKIRGGGTILGASQSGHIAAVGYEMFLQLMESSISELKGEPVVEDLEPEINLPLSAFLPETYIPDIDQRLSLYRRLARMTDLKTIGALKAEMQDRFGPLPEEAGNLMLKIMLKVLAVRAGCRRLDLNDSQAALQFSEIHQQRPSGIVTVTSLAADRYRLTPDHLLKAQLTPGPPNALLAQIKNILIEIARHVNQ